MMGRMKIFHIAFEQDWIDARAAGVYTVSTIGKSLGEVGFIHASFADQVLLVADNFYTDTEAPLVLLAIESDLLASKVVVEPVPGTEMSFPHIYGPIDPDAVTAVYPFGSDINGSFTWPAIDD